MGWRNYFLIKSRNICYTRYPENYDTLLPWLPVLNAWEGNIRNSQLTVSLGKNVTLHSPTLFILPSRYRLSRTKAYCSLVPSSNKINQFHPISLYLSRVQNLTDTKAFINDTERRYLRRYLRNVHTKLLLYVIYYLRICRYSKLIYS